mgnify:CR=1 FL=1
MTPFFGEFFHGRSLSARRTCGAGIGAVAYQQHHRHRIVARGRVFEHRASRQSHFRTADDEHVIRSAQPRLTPTARLAPSGRNATKIIFEGTDDAIITGDTKWKEYEFKAKPGNPDLRPPFIAPYQPRIDWQIWFAAMGSPAEYPWTLHFVWKLLHNDPGTLSLLGGNPFPLRPPHYIRAQLYRLSLRAAGRSGVVETRTNRRMVARVFSR